MDELANLRFELVAVLKTATTPHILVYHFANWLLKKVGDMNIGIWICSEDEGVRNALLFYESDPDDETSGNEVEHVLAQGIVQRTLHEHVIHAYAASLFKNFTEEEMQYLNGNDVYATTATYLDQICAVIVMFRPESFTARHEQIFDMAEIIFVSSLMNLMSTTNSGKKETSSSEDPADWWKNGESPPI